MKLGREKQGSRDGGTTAVVARQYRHTGSAKHVDNRVVIHGSKDGASRLRDSVAMGRVMSIMTPIALLTLWEVMSDVGILDARFFPPPHAIIGYFFESLFSGDLLRETGTTLYRVIVGFAIGAIPGLLLGLFTGTNRLARAGMDSVTGLLFPIPKIAILPLVILLFGITNTTLFLVVAFGVFFPMLISTQGAVTSIEKIYFDVGGNVGASKLRQFFTIALPGAVPGIASGIRIAWATALLIIIGSEFVASQSGLGFVIYSGWQTFQIKMLYAGLISVSLLGICSFTLLSWAERTLIPWKTN